MVKKIYVYSTKKEALGAQVENPLASTELEPTKIDSLSMKAGSLHVKVTNQDSFNKITDQMYLDDVAYTVGNAPLELRISHVVEVDYE